MIVHPDIRYMIPGVRSLPRIRPVERIASWRHRDRGGVPSLPLRRPRRIPPPRGLDRKA